jgi:hypothetical protein
MTSDRNGGGNAPRRRRMFFSLTVCRQGFPVGARSFAARGPVVQSTKVATGCRRRLARVFRCPPSRLGINQKPFSGLREGANSAQPDHMNRQHLSLTAAMDPWQEPSLGGHTLRAIDLGVEDAVNGALPMQ